MRKNLFIKIHNSYIKFIRYESEKIKNKKSKKSKLFKIKY